MTPPTRPTATVLLCLTLATSGCGGPGPDRVATVAVTGKVTFKGKPLPKALVVFQPEAPLKAADGTEPPNPSGTTGEDGVFSLQTYEPDDGAPPGRYLVAISTTPRSGADEGILRKRSKEELTDVLKGRYLDPKASGVSATVSEGPTELPVFDLK